MSTLELIKMDAESAMDKARRGEKLTAEELKSIKIFNSLSGAKAFNAGKRKIQKTGN